MTNRGLHKGGIYSGDYDPPGEWERFSIRLITDSEVRAVKTVPSLTDEELAWVTRVVIAVIQQRSHGQRPCSGVSNPAPAAPASLGVSDAH